MTEPVRMGKERQLFIDDYCVGSLRGVRRRFHQMEKHPANPIMIPQEPWEATYIQLYGNVLYDEGMGLYRMWYSARYAPEGPGSSLNTVCHASSRDGVDWDRTRLNRLEHKGLVLSNAVLKGSAIGPTVFHTPSDPDPARRYRMFVYTGEEIIGSKDRTSPFSQHYSVLFSPDGFVWTPYENNPVVQGGDIATCAYDPVTDEYIAFPKIHRTDGGRYRRCVGVSVSKDFMRWLTPNIVLSADELDDSRVEARLSRFRELIVYDNPEQYISDMYGMTGFRYEGLRLGLVWFYDISARRPRELGGNDDGVINIQLAYSRDEDPYNGWRRAGDRCNILSCGDEGEYDSACLFTAHTVIERKDDLLIYYTGSSTSHGYYLSGRGSENKPMTKSPPLPVSLNLAVLRLDGFASIEALYPPGILITKLLTFEGGRLIINADAEKGSMLVEFTDAEGNPIPGYTKEDCVPFCRDEIRGEVRWSGGAGLDRLKGRPVHIVFYLKTARLYSFKFC